MKSDVLSTYCFLICRLRPHPRRKQSSTASPGTSAAACLLLAERSYRLHVLGGKAAVTPLPRGSASLR